MSHCDEITPLLETDPNDAPETRARTSQSASNSPLWTILSLSAVMLILDISSYVAIAPETAIFEDIACNKYYTAFGHAGDSNSERCKIEPIQSEVALISGWKDALETIPGDFFYGPHF